MGDYLRGIRGASVYIMILTLIYQNYVFIHSFLTRMDSLEDHIYYCCGLRSALDSHCMQRVYRLEMAQTGRRMS